jgi:hypothetical protein
VAELEGGDDFFEGAEEFGEVGGGDEGVGAGEGGGRDFEGEFVAGAGGEAGVVAGGGDGFARDGAAIAPEEGDAAEEDLVGGGGPVGIGRGDEGTARGGGGGGVHDELEMAGGEGAVGVSVVGNAEGGDEDGAGLLGFPVLLSLEGGGVVGIEFLVEEVVAGVAEGEGVNGIVLYGEGAFVGRLLGESMRWGWSDGGLGRGVGVSRGGEMRLGGVAGGEPGRTQDEG